MRVITGSARGAKLKAPKGMQTRPTADRIKESLFNILQTKVINAQVLDIFAGSGALGLEALSRGAKSAVFIDKSNDSIKIIKDNAQHTHLAENIDIWHGDALLGIKRLYNKNCLFDIIFCDPPYHMGLCQRILYELDQYNLLKHKGLFIAEIGADEELDINSLNFNMLRSQTYGSTTRINIYEYISGGE